MHVFVYACMCVSKSVRLLRCSCNYHAMQATSSLEDPHASAFLFLLVLRNAKVFVDILMFMKRIRRENLSQEHRTLKMLIL